MLHETSRTVIDNLEVDNDPMRGTLQSEAPEAESALLIDKSKSIVTRAFVMLWLSDLPN